MSRLAIYEMWAAMRPRLPLDHLGEVNPVEDIEHRAARTAELELTCQTREGRAEAENAGTA